MPSSNSGPSDADGGAFNHFTFPALAPSFVEPNGGHKLRLLSQCHAMKLPIAFFAPLISNRRIEASSVDLEKREGNCK